MIQNIIQEKLVDFSTGLIKKCKGFYTDVIRPYKKSHKF